MLPPAYGLTTRIASGFRFRNRYVYCKSIGAIAWPVIKWTGVILTNHYLLTILIDHHVKCFKLHLPVTHHQCIGKVMRGAGEINLVFQP